MQRPKQINVEAFHALQTAESAFTLIDVREKDEYAICHLDGLLLPLSEFENGISHLDKNHYYILMCKHGRRSEYAMQILLMHGFTQISNLQGGIIEYIKKINPRMTLY